jgi:hypothetical protein
MKRVSLVFVLALSLLTMVATAGDWTGVISDAKCGAAHAAASEKDANCVKGCVKKGSAPVFVSEGKVLKIANADKVNDHLGHKVKVSGKLEGDTLTIDKLEMAH